MNKPIEVTQGVMVSVETDYRTEQSSPLHNNFFFSYQICIENYNEYPVQLLSRKWIIVDSTGNSSIVEGEGVVGEKPVLDLNDKYEYTSFCHLKTEVGKMFGFYTFENKVDGSLFKVTIPEFTLITPFKLN